MCDKYVLYTSNTASSGNPGLSGGAIAGIVIAVIAVTVALIVGVIVGGVGIHCWWKRR